MKQPVAFEILTYNYVFLLKTPFMVSFRVSYGSVLTSFIVALEAFLMVVVVSSFVAVCHFDKPDCFSWEISLIWAQQLQSLSLVLSRTSHIKHLVVLGCLVLLRTPFDFLEVTCWLCWFMCQLCQTKQF